MQVHMQQQTGRALFKARRSGLKMPGPAWPGPFRTLFSLPSRSLYIPNYDKTKLAAVTIQVDSCVGLCRFPTRIMRIRVWCRLTVASFHLLVDSLFPSYVLYSLIYRKISRARTRTVTKAKDQNENSKRRVNRGAASGGRRPPLHLDSPIPGRKPFHWV
jgi:hypothetical protein